MLHDAPDTLSGQRGVNFDAQNLSHAFIPVVTAWFAERNTVPEYKKAVAFLRTEGGKSANKQWTKIYLDALHAHALKIDADIDTEGVDAADLFCSIIYSLKTDSGLTATRWKRVVLGDRDQHIRNAITLTVPRVVAECGEEDDGEPEPSPTRKSERVETYNDDYQERYSSEGEGESLASEGEEEEESLASEGEEVGDSQGSEEEEEESVPVPVKPKRGAKPKKAEEVAEATPKRVEGVAGSKPRKAIKAKKN